MTTPDSGNSDKRGDASERDSVDGPDLRKKSDSAPQSPPENSAEVTHEFGRTFDYDATAQASLSEQPPTPESLGGSVGTPGPGWDTYSGMGNGPGWGTTPSYPPPSENPQSDYPAPGSAEFGAAAPHSYPNGPQQGFPPQYGTPGPVYGTPDPQYPIGGAPGYLPPNPPGVPHDPYGNPQPYGAYGPPPAYPGGPAGFVDPSAPYGRDPYTGEPFSDKSKVTAGLLEILLGAFGAGRFYLDQPGMAIAQIAVTWLTCGIGGIWPLIDGIMMLTGKVRDNHGRPLQP
ncbi:NINE protein [Rhodococcus sp. HNM0563]|nr:NINE protein [Rhodococcus sp. HNM0563]